MASDCVVKNCFKNSAFLSESSIFCTFRTILFGLNFASMWPKYISNNVYIEREFRHPVSAFATVTRKSFNGKFTAKIDFPIGHFIIADANIFEV